MSKWIWAILGVDLIPLVASVVFLMGMIVDPELFADKTWGRNFLLTSMVAIFLLNAFAILAILTRHRWVVHIHDFLAFLFFFSFPLGTGYTFAYILKLRKELKSFVGSV